MTIKVECSCGTRYSFDVEPQGGVMPFQVSCPSCKADGTAAANQIIAQTLNPVQAGQPRLRMREAATPAPAAVAPLPSPPPPTPAAGAAVRKLKAEARQTRMMVWMLALFFLLVIAALGAWGWFSFVGSKPTMAFSMKLPGAESGWHTEFLEGGKVLLASANRAIVRDVNTGRDLWSTELPSKAADDSSAPQVLVDKQTLWICTGAQVVRLDQKTGEVKLTVPIVGEFSSFTPTDASILVVSATSETRRVAMRIDLASGETSSQDVEVPRAQKQAMPDELPPNVQPTAGVLLAQATEEHKFNKPLDAMSSEFFSAGQNLIELRVRLLEPRVTWVKSIKPRGPSLINGNTTAATSTTDVESEVFNDIKRDQTGGVKAIDESRYGIKLRRWLGEKPVEWEGEVTGVPSFFSLQTVDLLVAGKNLSVFDKQNKKLFDAQLSYPIGARFTTANAGHQAPAVERNGVLYFFDQGVLTAMSLPGGQVQWRLTTVGISRAQFDEKGMLYVDTTAGSPEDIQYSDQIKFVVTKPVILKVDPQSGKILWQTFNLGQHSYLSGKYLYSVSADKGGVAMAVGLAEAIGAPRPEAPTHFHVHRLDPETGREIWDFFREEAPDEEAFQQNWFVLRFGDEVQAWKFLSF